MKLLPHQQKRCMDCKECWYLCGRCNKDESKKACEFFRAPKLIDYPLPRWPELETILKYMD